MKRMTLFVKNFNWRMLLMRIAVNMLALLVMVLLVPKIYFVDRSLVTWIWLALALGVLNALIKPVIQVLTLRFIFATGGLVVILIDSAILWLLAWLFPSRLAVDSLLWALVGGAVLGLLSIFLESLLGLTPPIVSEKYPELRQRVKDRQFYRTQSELIRIEAQKSGIAREIAVATVMVTSAHPNAAQLITPDAHPATSAAPTIPTEAPAPVAAAIPITEPAASVVPEAVDAAPDSTTASQQEA